MSFAARITDMVVPGGVVVGPGIINVLIKSLPAAVMGDANTVYGTIPGIILKGSSSVLIGGRPAARVGDQTTLGGTIMLGAFTVIIGG